MCHQKIDENSKMHSQVAVKYVFEKYRFDRVAAAFTDILPLGLPHTISMAAVQDTCRRKRPIERTFDFPPSRTLMQVRHAVQPHDGDWPIFRCFVGIAL